MEGCLYVPILWFMIFIMGGALLASIGLGFFGFIVSFVVAFPLSFFWYTALKPPS